MSRGFSGGRQEKNIANGRNRSGIYCSRQQETKTFSSERQYNVSKWKACSQAKSYRSENGQTSEETENSNLIEIKKNRPPPVLLLSLQPVTASEKGNYAN